MSSNNGSIALDVITLKQLDLLAQNWGTSREAAAARAIAQAKQTSVEVSSPSNSKAAVLKLLQQSLKITPEKAIAWQEAVHDARR